MPGFWESLGQGLGSGLQNAGAVLSPEVYQEQAIERRNSVVNLMNNLKVTQLQRNLDANQKYAEISKGLNLSGLSPDEQLTAFTKAVPLDVLGQSDSAQQGLQLIMAGQKQEEAKQLKLLQLQNARDIAQAKLDAATTPFMRERNELDRLEAAGQGNTPRANDIRRHLARMDAPVATTVGPDLSKVTTEDLKGMSWADLSKRTGMGLSEDAFRNGSMQYALTGKPPAAAYRNQAARNAWEEGRAKIANEFGMTPEQVALQSSEWKANALALNKLTVKRDQIGAVLSSFHNNINTFEAVAEGRPPQLSGERIAALGEDFKNISFTDVTALNKMKLAISRQFNDPATVAYVTAAVTVAMDYARILASQGQSAAQITEGARNEAMRLIEVGYNKKAREALLGTLESDTAGQIKGLDDQVKTIRGRMGIASASGQDQSKSDPLGIR